MGFAHTVFLLQKQIFSKQIYMGIPYCRLSIFQTLYAS